MEFNSHVLDNLVRPIPAPNIGKKLKFKHIDIYI